MDLKQQLRNSAKDLTILVMDKDEKISLVIVRFLEQFFKSVEYCSDVKEALTAFKTHRHDIVMCDLNLPGMEGIALIKEVLKTVFVTPTVLISEKKDHVIYKWGVDAGVDYVIHKPYKTDEVIAALAPLSQIKRFHNMVEQQARRIKNVLDVQPHLYCVYKEREIVFANQAFYHFFDITKVSQMNDKENSLQGKLEDIEGYYSSKDEKWFEDALTKSDQKLKVRLFESASQEMKTYRLYVSKGLELDEYVIALIDNTERESNEGALKNLSVSDALTGLLNGVEFQSIIEESIILFKEETLTYRHKLVELEKKQSPKEKAQNQKNSLKAPHYSLLFFDIDNLCNVKMTQGYRVRDTLIKEVVNVINENLDEGLLFARWSGEEFVIACPKYDLDGSEALAERLRMSIEEHDFSSGSDISCSFGVTQLFNEDSFDTFLDRAEKLLVSAKRAGHNCVMGNRSADEVSEKEMQARNEIMQIFEEITHNKEEISVHSYFKGMGLQRDTVILDCNKTGISVNASVNLLVAMYDTDVAYIVNERFEQTVKARVTNMFVPQEKAVLSDFTYVSTSPLERKVIKLETKSPILSQLSYRKKVFEAEIVEISINAMTLNVKEDITLRKGSDVNIKFMLPQSEESEEEFITNSKVLRFVEVAGETHLFIRLFLDKTTLNGIKKYIHLRQFELSNEVISKVKFLKGKK
jgi:diguanylate cyclase (GGDEF)-like protein